MTLKVLGFKKTKTRKKENGLKIWKYESGNYWFEIDELKKLKYNYCIADANFQINNLNTYAKTKKTLFSQISTMFI